MTDNYDLMCAQREALIRAHAYDPLSEKDACGVGIVCAINKTPSREVVVLALNALKALFHRGAVDADGRSGDGAGIMISIPQAFFRSQVESIGQSLRSGPLVVGQIFYHAPISVLKKFAERLSNLNAQRQGFIFMDGAKHRLMSLSWDKGPMPQGQR